MSATTDLEFQQEQQEHIIFPDSDLYSNEPPLETYLHLQQMILLLKCLEWWWRDRNDFFTAGNLTIYYSPCQKKSEDFRGPDFFVVLGTEKKPRKSWVVWAEDGKYPHVIVEILSESTAQTDREFKKQLYQDTFRTPDYFWFDPESLEFVGLTLIRGVYQPIEANEQGWLWSQQLGLYLGIYQGQLRYFREEGELVPTPEEAAEFERQQKELAQQQAEKLRQKLRELGVEPD